MTDGGRDMDDRDINELAEDAAESPAVEETAAEAVSGEQDRPGEDLNNKYLRLYAEFDNYRKRVAREKEEMLRYGNESLLYEMLPALDHLELALKHAGGGENSGLMQGVEMTLKELQRTLEKFGLRRIEAAGKCFDPAVHHAMMQVERDDMEDKMVADELRAGYLYHDKVLRPSLVAVSVKPRKAEEPPSDETCGAPEEEEINSSANIEEE